MDSLPVEIFYVILSELPHSDLFNCKRVCKRWANLIDSFYLKRIVITKTGLSFAERSFENYDKISHLNLVIKNDLLENELKKKMFVNLKELSIYEREIQFSLIAKINCLKSLERLDLFKLVLDDDCELNLPSLIALNLCLIVQKTSRNQIRLSTPCLAYLKLNKFNHSKIVYEDKIIRAHSLGYDKQLKNLVNLESIKIDGLNAGDLEDDFLERLDKLEDFDYEGDRSVFSELERQIRSYERYRIRIYHYGVCYKNKPSLRVMNYDHRLTGMRMGYYLDRMKRLADRLPNVSMVEFDETFFYRLDEKLLKKLIGIRVIYAMIGHKHSNKIEQSLENIMKYCNITKLTCYYLNESFYLKLPHSAPFLTSISFGVVNDEFDWSFLPKLKLLKQITTVHCIKLEDLEIILKSLPNLLVYQSKIEENLSVKFQFKGLFKGNYYEIFLNQRKFFQDFGSRKDLFTYFKNFMLNKHLLNKKFSIF